MLSWHARFVPAEGEDGSGSLEFSVEEWDERYRSVTMAVAAPGMIGTLKGFLRPKPQRQTAWPEIKELVTPGEFIGQKSR